MLFWEQNQNQLYGSSMFMHTSDLTIYWLLIYLHITIFRKINKDIQPKQGQQTSQNHLSKIPLLAILLTRANTHFWNKKTILRPTLALHEKKQKTKLSLLIHLNGGHCVDANHTHARTHSWWTLWMWTWTLNLSYLAIVAINNKIVIIFYLL